MLKTNEKLKLKR